MKNTKLNTQQAGIVAEFCTSYRIEPEDITFFDNDPQTPFFGYEASCVLRQCKAANVPVFVKQLGGNIFCGNDNGFEGEHDQAWPVGTVVEHTHEGAHVRLKDKKGGDMSEWPLDLRIREMPTKGEVNIKNG